MDKILTQILALCAPSRVILFAEKRTLATDQLKTASFCIVLPGCDKDTLLKQLYLNVDSEMPLNFTLYTDAEWADLQADHSSYAAWIGRRGRVVYEQTT